MKSGMVLVKYEWKKIFLKPANRAALLLLLACIGIVSYFAVISISYTDRSGKSFSGPKAAACLRKEKNQWAGELTTEVLQNVLEANREVNTSPEYLSNNVTDNDIAFSRKQGFSDIREMINQAFSGFQEYDYYRADNISEDEVVSFYDNRVKNLRNWLYEGDGKDQFSENEKSWLISRYETLERPLHYEYADGWKSLLEYMSVVLMAVVLITGFLVSGIFADEFAWRAAPVFFSSCYGRNKGTGAKIKAGFLLITVIYWLAVLLYSGLVLLCLGAGGGNCMIQTGLGGWKSWCHITFFQEYLLSAAGGYIGTLFILAAAMTITAKTRSAVLGASLPFILLFLPAFLPDLSGITKMLGLLPDQLLQLPFGLNTFSLYQIGKTIVPAVPILFLVYSVMSVLLLPAAWQIYRQTGMRQPACRRSAACRS